MSREEKKDYYKSILNNGEYSSKGGGGLGIIDIARRSSEKLEYGFVPVDEQNAFFTGSNYTGIFDNITCMAHRQGLPTHHW